MSRFKICPYCGTHNEPTLFDCKECGADISSVKSIDEELLALQKQIGKPENSEETGTLYKRCTECGHYNPSNARKCVNCGEDISDILPCPKEAY